MRAWKKLLFVLVAALLAVLVWAGWPPARDKMVFRSMGDAPRGFGIRIREGQDVNAAIHYPAAFYAYFDQQCSGTLIGRNAMLMSAHCVFADGPTVVDGPWGELKAECRRHQKYQGTPAFDIALCRTNDDIRLNGYEQIVRASFQLGTDAPIVVTGWGETAYTKFGRWWARVKFRLGYAGRFRIGKATGTANGPTIDALGAMTETGRIAIENGDSGGAAYVGPDETRRIVGVTSCGGCGEPDSEKIGLANLADEQTAEFIDRWADEFKAHICGRDPSQDDGCRK